MKGFRLTIAIAAALAATACSESLPTGAISDATPSYTAGSRGETSGNKLQCFHGQGDGYGSNGTCTLISGGALIETVDGDTDNNNNYAGVYVPSNLGGRLLGDVNRISFSYDGTGAAGGSPRISIPIDEDGDGDTEAYAFIETLGCNDGDANVGTLDVINDATCTIWYSNISYANWSALVTANPTFRIASDALTFIIVDQPGTFEITNVQLGKAAAKSRG